ncbi:MAG: radical SAM protein [Candidatus Hydrogenedentes bacterium]|nr:radical SAM protein [Candidatus Hydrogenedentota bacterium]
MTKAAQINRQGKLRFFLAAVSPPSSCALVTPPLGLLYIAAWLRERFSLDICVVNQRVEGWSSERLVKEAIAFEPDIIGLGCMTPSSYALPGITEALRVALPNTLQVLGGPHIAAFGEDSLAVTAADAAVVGEGEVLMEQIVRAVIEGGTMADIPGLIRRDTDGTVVVNPGMQPLIEDLDTLPLPAYDLIDVSRYWRQPAMAPIPRRKYMALFSSRGCPYGCIYCHNVFGRKFRAHSAARMVEEIEYGMKTFGVEEVEFVDDCFNLDRKRVLEYSELLQQKVGAVKTIFPNAIRGDLLDVETVDALVGAGMYYTALALESGTPRIQELIRKRLNIPKFLEAVALCAERKVFTNGYVMLGFPTETEAEIKETIRVASESRLNIASFFRVTPFPNTPLYKYVEEHSPEKLAAVSYNEMEYWRVKVNLSAVSDKTLDWHLGNANRNFYLRPKRLYRLLREYPKPMLLPGYGWMFLKRIAAGLA